MFAAMMVGWKVLFGLVLLPIILFTFAFWLWMLVDCLKSNRLPSNEKLIWVIVLVFTHFLGALIYFFVGRPKANPA
jgi:hypothetical protein